MTRSRCSSASASSVAAAINAAQSWPIDELRSRYSLRISNRSNRPARSRREAWSSSVTSSALAALVVRPRNGSPVSSARKSPLTSMLLPANGCPASIVSDPGARNPCQSQSGSAGRARSSEKDFGLSSEPRAGAGPWAGEADPLLLGGCPAGSTPAGATVGWDVTSCLPRLRRAGHRPPERAWADREYSLQSPSS